MRNKNNFKGIKPVKSVELNSKHIKLRVVILILALLTFVGSVIALFYFLLHTDDGWQSLSISYGFLNNDKAISLNYYLGKSGNATNEKKAIENMTISAIEKSYKNLDNYSPYEDYNNVYMINHNYNKDILVDDFLYDALKKAKGYKTLYLGPIMDYYDAIISSDENDAKNYDPVYNEEINEFFLNTLEYINDESQINIEIKDNNIIRLNISLDYLNYAQENDIENFISFSWLKNAFIMDYIADKLINYKYTYGFLTSVDGYSINLGCDESFMMYLYDYNKVAKNVASFEYQGRLNIVSKKNFIINTTDKNYIKQYSEDDRRTYLVDYRTGISNEASNYYVAASKNISLSDIALNLEKVYICDEINKSEFLSDISYFWVDSNKIYYSDSSYTIAIHNDEYQEVKVDA